MRLIDVILYNMKKILFALFLGVAVNASAQLPNGSIAPDFTLTDLFGNEHRLYDYLNEGKVVYLEFFACHCPSCWAYHTAGTLESLYQAYGPNGTDQIMVLMLEHDPNNGDDHFYGNHWYTQGDWVTGTTIPKFNVEGNDRIVFNNYDMAYYPMVYKICPDKTTELMSTSQTVAELYQAADDCPGTLSIEDETTSSLELKVVQGHLIIDGVEDIKELQIMNAIGQIVYSAGNVSDSVIDLNELEAGVYFVLVAHSEGEELRKIYLN